MGPKDVNISVAEIPLWQRYADQFPVRENLVYLNHAAVAPHGDVLKIDQGDRGGQTSILVRVSARQRGRSPPYTASEMLAKLKSVARMAGAREEPASAPWVRTGVDSIFVFCITLTGL